MERKIWVVTLHHGKGNENTIRSFSEYSSAIKFLEKTVHNGARLQKVDFIDESDYQSKLSEEVV